MTVREIIEIDQAREAKDEATIQAIAEELAKFEGKTVSKRMATAIEKRLGCLVSYQPDNTFSTIFYVWGGDTGHEYKHRMLLFVRRDNMGAFSLKAFKDNNPAYFAGLQERMEQRREQLAGDFPEEALYLIGKFQEASEAIKEKMPNFSTPSWYEIKREFSLEGVQ